MEDVSNFNKDIPLKRTPSEAQEISNVFFSDALCGFVQFAMWIVETTHNYPHT